jgi:thiamine biosynthesis protein ThiI
VASQTLRNLVAVETAAQMPVFRPLIGADKMEILATARKIGTYDISSEPFHDCCPVFLPRAPALCAGPRELDEAESKLEIPALIAQGIRGTSIERFVYSGGQVEVSTPEPLDSPGKRRRAIA